MSPDSSKHVCASNDGWKDLCSLASVSEREGRYVEVGTRALAVFRGGEAVRVMDDACPHAGAPLSAGNVDQSPSEGACVVCSLHGWAFRLHDGRCPDNEAIGVRVYESRVVDGVVQAKL